MGTKRTSQKKSFPSNKMSFIKRAKKPIFFARLASFFAGLKDAFYAFFHPVIDEYNCYPLTYIWGNTLNGNLYSKDDISVVYNQKDGMFYLQVETNYLMHSTETCCIYLIDCLNDFMNYMTEEGLQVEEKAIFGAPLSLDFKAKTLEELFVNFFIYVAGFCAYNGYALTLEPSDKKEDDNKDFSEDEDYNEDEEEF